jgi:hypothetical protein
LRQQRIRALQQVIRSQPPAARFNKDLSHLSAATVLCQKEGSMDSFEALCFSED